MTNIERKIYQGETSFHKSPYSLLIDASKREGLAGAGFYPLAALYDNTNSRGIQTLYHSSGTSISIESRPNEAEGGDIERIILLGEHSAVEKAERALYSYLESSGLKIPELKSSELVNQ